MDRAFIQRVSEFGNGNNIATITPPIITVNQSNYNPAGLEECSILRLITNGNRQITGLMAPKGNLDYQLPLKLTNTVSVTTGSNLVTSAGFNGEIAVGDKIFFNGSTVVNTGDLTYIVASIINNTSLTLTSAYKGMTGSSLIAYATGPTSTIGATNGSANITGVRTAFLSQLGAGNKLKINNVEYTVASVTSDILLTLTTNYTGISGANFIAYKDSYRRRLIYIINANVSNLWIQFNTNNASSAPDNRYLAFNYGSATIYRGCGKLFLYDTNSFRWRILSDYY